MTSAIRTHDLTRSYGANRGILNVNLDIQQGEIFGFLGPNGAGKSTTLRTLLGYLRPTSGRGDILGMDIVADRERIRERIGNLPGEFTLDDQMTGRQMIDLFARLRNVSSTAYALDLAERLDANLDRPMRRLSRGNKQKVGIIQALFHQPDVVILDEPTGGLDPLVAETFLGLLEEARARGQTVFFSSHILAEIERVADRVGIIRDGEMVAVEDPRDLTSRTFRHVRITVAPAGAAPGIASRLETMPGVEHLRVDGEAIAFDAHGDMNAVVRLLAGEDLVSIDIERPSLEEVFLKYYDSHQPPAEALP